MGIYQKKLPELRAGLSASVEAGPESMSAEILNSSLIFSHNEPCQNALKQLLCQSLYCDSNDYKSLFSQSIVLEPFGLLKDQSALGWQSHAAMHINYLFTIYK